jgi:hypothetical protein
VVSPSCTMLFGLSARLGGHGELEERVQLDKFTGNGTRSARSTRLILTFMVLSLTGRII